MKLLENISMKIQSKFVIENYYDDLQGRVDSYRDIYRDDFKRSAIKLIIWNLKVLCKKDIRMVSGRLQDDSKNKLNLRIDKRNLNVAFVIGGGFGDNLIFCNYLYKFKKKFGTSKMRIDVFFSRGWGQADALLKNSDICTNYYKEPEENWKHNYDLIIGVGRYPLVYKAVEKKIKKKNVQLWNYVKSCKKFEKENRVVFANAPYFDGMTAFYSGNMGIKRIQQADFDGKLEIQPEFEYNPQIVGEESYLSSVKLLGKKYITFHRGSDSNYSKNVVKLWPLEYYNTLIELIKKRYPTVILVQMGISEDRCELMNGIDVNLVGKTTMEEVKILLKNSALHIDCEGGYVHLRESINGGCSVVLFGPTSMNFYGYKNNINIKGNGCPYPCEWQKQDWLDHCVRGELKPSCMYSILPVQVFDKIVNNISVAELENNREEF